MLQFSYSYSYSGIMIRSVHWFCKWRCFGAELIVVNLPYIRIESISHGMVEWCSLNRAYDNGE